MPKHHDDSKLQKRTEGWGPIYTGWVEPGKPIPEGRIEVGKTITLKSTAGISIIARVVSLQHGRVTSEIVGFEDWDDEYHNGMTHEELITCDEAFVIGCDRD